MQSLCQSPPVLTTSNMGQFGLLPSLKTSLRRRQMPNMPGPHLGRTEGTTMPLPFLVHQFSLLLMGTLVLPQRTTARNTKPALLFLFSF